MATKRSGDAGRLGGGWIAAALGLSEYASPLDAYLRVTGEVVDEREGEAIDRGNFLEPALRAWHAKKLDPRTPARITEPGTIFHPEYNWASYTPDGIAESGGRGPLLAEYKSPGENTVMKYGEPGTDQVPRDVGVQVHWGLFVTDLPRADVAALIGGELRLFHIEQDRALEQEMFERAKHFMENYVAKKVPPPPTYSERDTAWVKNRWPKSDPDKRRAWSGLSPEEQRIVALAFELNRERKAAEKREAELGNVIKEQILQNHVAIDGDESSPFKRLDWKSNSTVGPAWKGVAEGLLERTVRAMESQGWGEAAREMEKLFAELVKKNTGEPPRVFKFYPHKGE